MVSTISMEICCNMASFGDLAPGKTSLHCSADPATLQTCFDIPRTIETPSPGTWMLEELLSLGAEMLSPKITPLVVNDDALALKGSSGSPSIK